MKINDKRVSSEQARAAVEAFFDVGGADAGTSDRTVRVIAEMERQRRIYRLGTDEAVIRRAAIAALMERGEY